MSKTHKYLNKFSLHNFSDIKGSTISEKTIQEVKEIQFAFYNKPLREFFSLLLTFARFFSLEHKIIHSYGIANVFLFCVCKIK